MNECTRNQAYVPNVCTVIQNPVGTAPVMWFERNGKVLVSMPGVPTEMKTVMKEAVISRLREYFQDHSSILHRTCLVYQTCLFAYAGSDSVETDCSWR